MYACVNVCVCAYSPTSIGSLFLFSSYFQIFLRIWSHYPRRTVLNLTQGSSVTSGELIRNLVSAHSRYLCVYLLLIFHFEVGVSVNTDFPLNWSQCQRTWKHPILEGIFCEKLSLLRRLPLKSSLRWCHYPFQFLRTERVKRWRRIEGESFLRLPACLPACHLLCHDLTKQLSPIKPFLDCGWQNYLGWGSSYYRKQTHEA